MQGASTVDNEWLDSIVHTAAGGGGFAVVLIFLRWLLDWLTGRHDRRIDILIQQEASLDLRWAAYTKKIEERCEKMEAEVEECHAHKHALEVRIARLEGFDHGMGDRRQEEQREMSRRHIFGDKGDAQ